MISISKRIAHLRDTKNGTNRTVPSSYKAVSVLEMLPTKTSYIFATTDTAVRLAWPRLTKRAGIHNLHFHDLRHEAISRLFEKGNTIPEIAAVSGHRTMSQLFRYAHSKKN